MSTEYGIKELENDFGPLAFGKALAAHRKGEEMTQKQFADFLGITSSSLCDLEKGRRIPSVKRAAKIAKALGMSEKTWIKFAIQDMIREAELEYIVSVA